jgi:integrase
MATAKARARRTVKGFSRSPCELAFEGTSSDGRLVPIPLELVTILEQHKLADPWKGDLVFPNDRGTLYSPNSKPGELLEEALEECRMPRIRVHDLRHVFASYFVMSGGDIFTLQRILGHSTPQITSDTYAHLSPAHLAGAADRVSFPKPPEPARVIPFQAPAFGD